MTRYSVKRGRRIKKYKKSRTGRGKGRRSIRRCKTRKPKIFRKAKRHTVSKRRNMVGGVCEGYNFRVTSTDVSSSKQFKDILTNQEKTLTLKLTLIGYCIAFVTRLDGILNADNRPEYLVFFRYAADGAADGADNIVIVRAKCPIDITKINFQTSGSDYTPLIIGVLKVSLNAGNFKKQDGYEIPLAAVNKLLSKLHCRSSMSEPVTSMFNSYVIISTNGSYRIVVCNVENSPFTPTFIPLNTTQNKSTNISKLLENVVNLEKVNDYPVKGFFRVLPELQYPSIAYHITEEEAMKLQSTVDALRGYQTPNDSPEAREAMNTFELEKVGKLPSYSSLT